MDTCRTFSRRKEPIPEARASAQFWVIWEYYEFETLRWPATNGTIKCRNSMQINQVIVRKSTRKLMSFIKIPLWGGMILAECKNYSNIFENT